MIDENVVLTSENASLHDLFRYMPYGAAKDIIDSPEVRINPRAALMRLVTNPGHDAPRIARLLSDGCKDLEKLRSAYIGDAYLAEKFNKPNLALEFLRIGENAGARVKDAQADEIRRGDLDDLIDTAAEKADIGVLQYLYEAGVALGLRTFSGTPLHAFARGNVNSPFKYPRFEACADILIAGGGDINARDYGGNTPIMLAAMRADSSAKDMVDALLKFKPDLTVKNSEYKTAFDLAVPMNFLTHSALSILKAGLVPQKLTDEQERKLTLKARDNEPDLFNPFPKYPKCRMEVERLLAYNLVSNSAYVQAGDRHCYRVPDMDPPGLRKMVEFFSLIRRGKIPVIDSSRRVRIEDKRLGKVKNKVSDLDLFL